MTVNFADTLFNPLLTSQEYMAEFITLKPEGVPAKTTFAKIYSQCKGISDVVTGISINIGYRVA